MRGRGTERASDGGSGMVRTRGRLRLIVAVSLTVTAGFLATDPATRTPGPRAAAAGLTDLLGIWVDAYADDGGDPDAEWISVAYFAADATAVEGVPDPEEVSEQEWFAPAELPSDLAPPGTLRSVLDAWEARV